MERNNCSICCLLATAPDTQVSCVAEEPYTECSDDLIGVFTIVIYFFVVFFSFIFNPWVSTGY